MKRHRGNLGDIAKGKKAIWTVLVQLHDILDKTKF